MRIDLPGCNFKNCKYSFDGNCTNKQKYENCDYRHFAEKEIAKLPNEVNDSFFVCPKCLTAIYHEEMPRSYDCCPYCGQKIDWRAE